MSWVSYHWYIDLKEARDLAGDDSIGSEEADERVRVTNVLDREQEGLIIGHEYIKREKHKLDYIPVSIIPVGSTRMIRSDRHADDTIHEFGESFANLNRNIFAAEHRLWTYFMTGAGSTAKAPVFIEYDSSLQQLTPDDIKVSPAQKGHINLLDKAKGQAYRGQLEAPSFAHVQFMLQGIQGKLSMGGIPPIAMGSIDSALPVGTTSMLTHAAQSRLWPVKKNVEQQYKRLAAEILRQYVKGKFGKVTVWGKDKSNKDYQIEFSREGLDPKRRVECELVPSLPQEEQVNMGMAAQAVQSGLLSPQSARDRWHLADDPDAEQDKINRFMAENDARVRDWTLAKQLWEDGQKFEAMVILNSLAEKARAGQQAFGIPDEAMMGGGGGRPVQGIPRMAPPSPTGTVARAHSLQVPPEVQEAIRLKQMGLVKGR